MSSTYDLHACTLCDLVRQGAGTIAERDNNRIVNNYLNRCMGARMCVREYPSQPAVVLFVFAGRSAKKSKQKKQQMLHVLVAYHRDGQLTA